MPEKDTKMPTEEARNMRRIVGSNWGLSITVVLALIGGLYFNMKLFSDMGERSARIEATLSALADNVREIKNNMTGITTAVRADLIELRKENSMIRERLAKVEAECDAWKEKK